MSTYSSEKPPRWRHTVILVMILGFTLLLRW